MFQNINWQEVYEMDYFYLPYKELDLNCVCDLVLTSEAKSEPSVSLDLALVIRTEFFRPSSSTKNIKFQADIDTIIAFAHTRGVPKIL